MAKLTRNLTDIDTVIIHCAATPNGKPFHVKDIDNWHELRSFHRGADIAKTFNPNLIAIGYHFVIGIDGTVETGRHPTEIGAHAAGYNSKSIGICMIGTDKFTAAQWASLVSQINSLRQQMPSIKTIIGHYQVDKHKTCPCFDVPAWLEKNMQPPAAQVL